MPQQENNVQLNDRSKRISYSELKIWNECPYKHKLSYIEGLSSFNGNEFTAFGTAVHAVCENILAENSTDTAAEFQKEFSDILSDLVDVDESLVEAMRAQGPKVLKNVLAAVQENFDDYEVFSIEEELYEFMGVPNVSKHFFKGFIDLVLKVEDTYHMIDWKTCSWGWNYKRKTEPITVYQLMLYKKFWAKKHDIPMENIKTYFALLKRTSPEGSVEIFEVTSGPKRVENASMLLDRALQNIDKSMFIKNRMSCKRCEFYKTEHCK